MLIKAINQEVTGKDNGSITSATFYVRLVQVSFPSAFISRKLDRSIDDLFEYLYLTLFLLFDLKDTECGQTFSYTDSDKNKGDGGVSLCTPYMRLDQVELGAHQKESFTVVLVGND
jgi:hypothetical protein